MRKNMVQCMLQVGVGIYSVHFKWTLLQRQSVWTCYERMIAETQYPGGEGCRGIKVIDSCQFIMHITRECMKGTPCNDEQMNSEQKCPKY